jgi:UDP-2,3-diacylglucosamine pyrophosphatase LpxH
MKYVNDYEEALIQFARKNEVQGVICGHIHRPEIRQVGEILYLNCGDWVENCTALVEDQDGHIELLRFDEALFPTTNLSHEENLDPHGQLR